MIGSIKGKVLLKTASFVIVEAGGVGYKINVSADTIAKTPKEGEGAALWIYTHVREDVLDLYGFMDREDLKLFEMLLGVSGIGPKSALAILGITTAKTLRRALGTGDANYLTKVAGIGKKTAEKIILELKDKMDKDTGGVSLKGELDALEALKSLGYPQGEAREALKKVEEGLSTSDKIREALKMLAEGH